LTSLDQAVSPSVSGSITTLTSMRARIPQHVVYRTLVSETVMLNIQTGKYYGLNETAGRMLELLERGNDVDAIAAQLANEFEASDEMVRRDLCTLCSDLAEKGLIEFESPRTQDSE
jgi:hypothetical protein